MTTMLVICRITVTCNRDLNLSLEQVLNQENEYKRKRESASYTSRMKEINRLTQKTTDIVATTSTLVRNTTKQVHAATYSCLRAVGIYLMTTPKLPQISDEDSQFGNPFENLMTRIQQRSAFKELFGLVVVSVKRLKTTPCFADIPLLR